jgi:hypothetical protein
MDCPVDSPAKPRTSNGLITTALALGVISAIALSGCSNFSITSSAKPKQSAVMANECISPKISTYEIANTRDVVSDVTRQVNTNGSVEMTAMIAESPTETVTLKSSNLESEVSALLIQQIGEHFIQSDLGLELGYQTWHDFLANQKVDIAGTMLQYRKLQITDGKATYSCNGTSHTIEFIAVNGTTTTGILDCKLNPPANSVGAEVKRYCYRLWSA